MTCQEGPEAGRLFSLFLDLVSIDSESRKEGRIGRYISEFCANMGLAAHQDDAAELTGGETGNIIVKVAGSPAYDTRPIIFNAHMDTVVPGSGVKVVEAEDRFTSGAETVLGADCKAGIAAILASLEWVANSGLEYRPIELIFTVQEEIGLMGAKHLDLSLVEGRCGLVLDGSGPVGGIVVEAPSEVMLRLTVRGKAAHAGVEPEKGVNAIACASQAIAGLRLGRLDRETTSNIGIISGGSAVNIVPDKVVVEGEIRSMSDDRLEEECGAVLSGFRSAAASSGCELEEEVERSFEHFKLGEDSKPVALLSQAMLRCGLQPELTSSGGGSDANLFNRAGLEAAVMHIGVANAHSSSEYILKEDLLAVARVISQLMLLPEGQEQEMAP